MTAMRVTLQRDAELAAGARSYVYKLVAEAFTFPAPEIAASITSGAWLSELSSVAGRLPYGPLPAPGDPDVLDGRGNDAGDLQRGYIGLFDVGRGQPYCPLYEGYHRAGRMKLMEDLVRFYEHFGLKHTPGDQPDHVCAELEFMHYLAFKEAASLAGGRPVAGLPLAQEDFLGRHLCRWLPKVYARLTARPDALSFYVSLAGLAAGFCAADLGWLRGCRENSDV
jgi:DMSO reductase family type II enzyme chaperone